MTPNFYYTQQSSPAAPTDQYKRYSGAEQYQYNPPQMEEMDSEANRS